MRELGERFRTLEGYGFGTIAATAKLVDEAIGVDPGSFDEAVVVGQPPRWGAVLWGGDYDVAAVDERLAGLGIERAGRDGATVWTNAADFEVDFADGPFAGVVRTNEFNTVRTAEVEQDGDLVRVTAPADGDAPVGRALRASTTADLRALA